MNVVIWRKKYIYYTYKYYMIQILHVWKEVDNSYNSIKCVTNYFSICGWSLYLIYGEAKIVLQGLFSESNTVFSKNGRGVQHSKLDLNLVLTA